MQEFACLTITNVNPVIQHKINSFHVYKSKTFKLKRISRWKTVE